jgi:DNA-binding IclR family transcriptional regulator
VLPLQLAAVYLGSDGAHGRLVQRLREIALETGLTTQLGVRVDDRVVIVASEEGSDAVKAAAMLGARLPLHNTAVGKAILAQMTDEEIVALLPEKLEAATANTITSRTALLEQIGEIRTSGIARADSELSEGLCAMSVPLPGSFGTALAGLTCAGPPPSILPASWDRAEAVFGDAALSFEGLQGAVADLARHV